MWERSMTIREVLATERRSSFYIVTSFDAGRGAGLFSRTEMRTVQLRPQPRVLTNHLVSVLCPRRLFHGTRKAPPIPEPRPFVPDVETFFTLIGRGLKKHASKFPSWKALFSLAPSDFKAMNIEPPRLRRYLIRWIHRYRAGDLGPGADFRFVEDGVALLKVASSARHDRAAECRCVVNVPPGETTISALPFTLVRPIGYAISGLRTITGPFARPLPGGAGAVVKITEGMWEDRRGRKIDGGERRQTLVRFKRRIAARREAAEEEALKHM
ncbi:hypothetical protein XA68_10831 [Ophiocordyceps unilateralis]|uniref:Small ribosomal subunit protein mS41 n=1 Tax=Ophiocordyceps unilateralis TaxID=268505 RepID=A0A2A9PI06_OPHUN|nr:hypothetical protein XA68_10831 [Ophiocordyceps unilateralis]